MNTNEIPAELLALKTEIEEIEAMAARGETPDEARVLKVRDALIEQMKKSHEDEEKLKSEGYALGLELGAILFEAFGKWAMKVNAENEGKGIKHGVQYYASLSALALLNFNVARSLFHGDTAESAYEWLSKLGQYSLTAFENDEEELTNAHKQGGEARSIEDVERQTREVLAALPTPEKIAADRAAAREKAKQDRLIAQAVAEKAAGAPLN
jgi:ribosomal protein L30E